MNTKYSRQMDEIFQTKQVTIESITVRHIHMNLSVPYSLSYRTFEAFEPYVVEVRSSNETIGWGDGHISPGSSEETREGGWFFCTDIAPQLLGLDLDEAIRLVTLNISESKVAGSALYLALEMLQGSSLLKVKEEVSFPLLTPINATDPSGIEAEIEQKLHQGFQTFKVKVGKDVEADIKRLARIQEVVNQRATLRVDANRAYTREEGIHFGSTISPVSLELFEQPCPTEDWESNAAVAQASNVPLMLDEPICSIADIERAAEIEGVRYCKLKLKRFGTLQALYEGLNYVRECGMEPVLGDGLGSELTSWMEACVAQTTIRNTGEFNGFLKPKDRLFSNPLLFKDGNLTLPKGYQPQMDLEKLEAMTKHQATFTK